MGCLISAVFGIVAGFIMGVAFVIVMIDLHDRKGK